MTDERHSLLFDIQRSVRYHDRRTSFFEFLHRVTNLLTILLAGIVLMELSGSKSPRWAHVLAGCGAIMGALDLIVGFSRGADTHRDLKRRFIALEQECGEGAHLDSIRKRRLAIEAEEPPIYRALDALCHIELCAAMGYEQPVTLGWFKRLTAHVLHWPNLGATLHARR